MDWTHSIARWWVDYLAMATVLLSVVVGVSSAVRQPAQRMATAWSATLGLIMLAICCAVPGWPRLALVANAPDIESNVRVAIPSGKEDPRSGAMTVPQWMTAKPMPKSGSLEAALQRGKNASASDVLPTKAPDRLARFDWLGYIAWSLMSGSLVLVVWLTYGQSRVWRLCRGASPAPDFAQAELRSVIGESARPPRLLVTDAAVAGATGLWSPAILLPREAVTASVSPEAESRVADRESLRALLAHEWAHIQRGDLWLLAISRLLLVALFVHPLYWLLRRRVLSDQEMLADAAAAECCGRHIYAEALVAWARRLPQRGSRLGWALGIWERPGQLSERIAVVIDENTRLRTACSRAWRIVCGSAAVALSAGLSVFSLNPTRTAVAEPAPLKPITKPLTVDLPAQVDAQTVVVEGSCVDEHSKPIANARVLMFRIDHSAKNFLKVRGRIKVTLAAELSGPNDKGQLISSGAGDPDKQRLLYETQTDTKGHFQFPSVKGDENWLSRADSTWIVAQSPNKGTALLPASLTRSTDGKLDIEAITFKLQPSAALRGRITNAEGQPVAGALVTPSEFNYLAKPVPGILCAVTDADGHYEINDMEETDVEDLPPNVMPFGTIRQASFVITVDHADYASGIIEYTKTPGTFNLVLQRPATLSGRVLLDENGGPANGARVRWTHENGTSDAALDTDAEGNYSLTRLQTGGYTITAHLGDRLDSTNKIQLTPGKNQLDLRLKQGGFIKGRVVDDATGTTPQFNPADGVVGGQVISVLEGRTLAADPSQNCLGYLNADGGFSMPVEPGRNLIHFFNPGFQLKDAERWGKDGVRVALGETVEIELRVLPRPGGWKSMMADARAVEAKAKGDSIPSPQPALEQRQFHSGDEETDSLANRYLSFPDNLLPTEPLSERATRKQLQAMGHDENGMVDSEGNLTSIMVGYGPDRFSYPHEPEMLAPELYVRLQYSVLTHIDKFRNLQTLYMIGMPGPDSWLTPLKGNASLATLYLGWCKNLTSAGIEQLAAIPHLKTLYVVGFHLDDKALAQINRFPELEGVMFGGVITDAGLTHLHGNSRLKTIVLMPLEGSRLTDKSLAELGSLPNLEELQFYPMTESQISNDGLKYLAGMQNLRELSLKGKQIDDSGLIHLQQLKNLKKLNLSETSVTAKSVDALRKHLPDAQVTGPAPVAK